MKAKFNFRFLVAMLLGIFMSVNVFAQQITITGTVIDNFGDPVLGANVVVKGTTNGATTDLDGNYSLKADKGSTLVVSYIGYKTLEKVADSNTVNFELQEDSELLDDVVVIGYGVAKKSDLTGSVTSIKPDTKNKGLVVNAQDMMQGKIAGVNISTNSGEPGAGAKIRVRGGSSLSGSNDPLIVIDGMAMDNSGVKGLANPLSMVNPADIESFNVLKDASATAIYGSRGSNGVIIITTKKGRKGMSPSVSYSGNMTLSINNKKVEVMDGNEYRDFITNLYAGDENYAKAISALGTANTDWQDLIFRNAISHDHNITVSGATKQMPYRLSVGYTDQQGTLKTSEFKRTTASLNLNPSFLEDHLTLNVNAKAMYSHSRFADGGAVGAAVAFDPTQDPYAYTSEYHKAELGDALDQTLKNFGGYFQWYANGSSLNNDNWVNTYNNLATKNPVDMLNSKNDRANSYSLIGSAEIDYKVHGFEDLRLHVTAGADLSKGKQNTDVLGSSALSIYYGSHGWEQVMKRNLQFSTYAQYMKDFSNNQHFDIMAGYEWQHVWRHTENTYWGLFPEGDSRYSQDEEANKYNKNPYEYKTENYLVSFFGRMNYSALDRYMLTATVRYDGASRFKEHWSLFPSVAFAWKLKNEAFLEDAESISDLKLRLGWGKTGQQEGVSDYNWIPTYSLSSGATGSFYPMAGDGTLYRPDNFTPELKWETTTTYNVGTDVSVLNDRLTFALDGYYRKTTDLLNYAPAPTMTAFRNMCWQNIGSLKNTGVEFAIDWKAIQTKDWYWTLNYNITYNQNEITDLTGVSDGGAPVETGPDMGGGTGNKGMAHQVGSPASSFYVYQQVYDEKGLPIENCVVDRNGDGQITSADRYLYKSISAPLLMGFSSRLEYKKWDFGFSLRANIGNYVYNNVEQSYSNLSKSSVWTSSNYMANRMPSTLEKNFQTDELQAKLTDYYVQNGSFLKLDNLTLGYSFDNLFKSQRYKGLGGRIYASATNVFTITKYSGLDPEVTSGVDSNMYPRALSFQVGVNVNF